MNEGEFFHGSFTQGKASKKKQAGYRKLRGTYANPMRGPEGTRWSGRISRGRARREKKFSRSVPSRTRTQKGKENRKSDKKPSRNDKANCGKKSTGNNFNRGGKKKEHSIGNMDFEIFSHAGAMAIKEER